MCKDYDCGYDHGSGLALIFIAKELENKRRKQIGKEWFEALDIIYDYDNTDKYDKLFNSNNKYRPRWVVTDKTDITRSPFGNTSLHVKNSKLNNNSTTVSTYHLPRFDDWIVEIKFNGCVPRNIVSTYNTIPIPSDAYNPESCILDILIPIKSAVYINLSLEVDHPVDSEHSIEILYHNTSYPITIEGRDVDYASYMHSLYILFHMFSSSNDLFLASQGCLSPIYVDN